MRAGHNDRCRQARKITVSQLVFGVATLSGCAQPPDTQVEADWIATMARYNMVGLYPIGEDLQPGDVLLHLPSEVGPQPTLRRIGSLNRKLLLDTMRTQEGRRLRVQVGSPLAPRPQSPAQALAAGGGPRLLKHDVLAADGGFGDDPVQPRMKRLVMPSIGAARVTEGQIAGAGPLGMGSLAGALGFGRRVAVLIRLKDTEMLGVDEALAHAQLGAARERWIKNHLSPRFLLDVVSGNAPSVVKRICAGEKAPGDRALLRVVNRVLYAHSIEYEFLRGNAVAGALAAELARTTAAGAAGGVPAAAPAAPASTGAPTGGASGTVAAAAAGLASVQQGFAGGVPPRPGITTRFGIGTFGNAAVTEVSPQPLAVAYVPLASYSVRGSLLVTSDDDASAERQMREAVGACDAALDDDGDEARRAPYLAARAAVQRAEEDRRIGRRSDPRPRTPIEDLLCNNTRDLLWQSPGLADAPRQPTTGKVGAASKTNGVGLFLPKRCTDPAVAPSAGLHVAGESTKVFPYRPGR